ncbi:MAG: hypothetical protein H3C29_07130 [Simplicispira suum]|uniref:hypothetical protein n=1 Tax=Simplicispira suum TaxID=2109915 RepID=UPI001C6C5F37|nr:hypothetical protein [Simplicispira suum]MBW7832972.1 hypothetical protein [Simplicispira suum]
MATRTIEDIHVVLPVAEGGYYRFGGLPGLIADALYPECPDADEEAQELQWMRHAIYGVEKFKKDLMRAAQVAEGEPGYLHVAENSASKRPLEWRMGAVLESGLVHLDWLNEWGESRRPPLVFSTVATQEPQDAPPAPVVAESASVVIHSTKARRDALTPVIELAQKECRNPQDTAEVWAVLLVLAEKKHAPLRGATEDGLQYLKGGVAAIFNRDALRKRLYR